MSEHKTLTGVEIKDADQGLVSAVFATLNVVDLDGDVTEPGAFEDGAAVRISAFGHTSWGGALPVGKGVIREVGDEAVLDGQFFMDTEHGRSTFATVKGLGELQEWSYGFDVLERAEPTKEMRAEGARQVLQKLAVHEVSPVLLGAGVATRTLAMKELSYVDEARAAHDAVEALVKRTDSLAEFGRGELTGAKREELKALKEALDVLEADRESLLQILAATDPEKGRDEFLRELVRFERLRVHI